MKKNVFIYGMLCLLVAVCCTQNQPESKGQNEERAIENLDLDPVITGVVDHFIVQLKQYSDTKSGDTIQLIGYLSFEKSDDPQKTKIRVEGIHQFTTDLGALKADDYFFRSGVFFFVNYNSSKPSIAGKKVIWDEVITKSNIKSYQGADKRKPCWLVEVDSEKVTKVYKYADSWFGKKQDKECITGDSGIECYELTEWGELVNDKGIVFDSIGGRSDYRW